MCVVRNREVVGCRMRTIPASNDSICEIIDISKPLPNNQDFLLPHKQSSGSCCQNFSPDNEILELTENYTLENKLTLYHTIPTFNDLENESFSKHCGKRRKCWLPAFSPFPTMLSALPKSNSKC